MAVSNPLAGPGTVYTSSDSSRTRNTTAPTVGAAIEAAGPLYAQAHSQALADRVNQLRGDLANTSGLGEWAAYYEPLSGVVFGQVVDRAAAADHYGVARLRTDLVRNLTTNSIVKMYTVADLDSDVLSIPAETVYRDTWFHPHYAPASRDAWHGEIAELASLGVQKLAELYPAT